MKGKENLRRKRNWFLIGCFCFILYLIPVRADAADQPYVYHVSATDRLFLNDWDETKEKESREYENVKAFSVAEENPYFCDIDGVLFSKDKTKLHIYPRKKPDKVYNVPKNTRCIEWEAFCPNEYLEEINIPDEVTEIEGYAFFYASLKKLTIGSGVKSIDEIIFHRSEIDKVEISPGLETLGYFAYGGDIKELVLPYTLTTLKKGAFSQFEGCRNHVLKLPPNIEVIPEICFSDVPIKEIILPEGLKRIEEGAFKYSEITRLRIPKNVTYIAPEALGSTTKLKDVEVDPANRVYKVKDQMLYSRDERILYEMLGGVETAYPKISEKTRKITSYAFYWNHKIKHIDIPEGVTKIEKNTFRGCEYLQSVKIPDTVKEIGEGAFLYCSSLRNINLPKGLKKLGEEVFGDTNIRHMRFPNGMTKLPNMLFSEGFVSSPAELTSVYIPKSVKVIDDPFGCCANLKHVYYGGSASDWKKIKILPIEEYRHAYYANSDFDAYHKNSNSPTTVLLLKKAKKHYNVSSSEYQNKVTQKIIIPGEIKYPLSQKTFRLKPKVNTEAKIRFMSKNPEIASVHPVTGQVTMKRMGEVTILIEAGAYKNYPPYYRRVKLTVCPENMKLGKVKGGKKRVTAKWKMGGDVSGYQVIVTKSSKSEKAIRKALCSKGRTSITLKKVSRGTRYVRIRSVKIVDGKKIYGNFSRAKKVKVK